MLRAFNPASMITKPDVLTSSTLKKAKIKALVSSSDKRYVELEVQFNPSELTVSKEVNWKEPEWGGKVFSFPENNAPIIEFKGGEAATFGLTLYFDTTQETDDSERDVRKYTNKLFLLTLYDGTAAANEEEPPPVQFTWGKFEIFTAVVTKVEVSYLLFHGNGVPARAKAEVSFKQYDWTDDGLPAQNPTTRTLPRKTRRVRQGERLDLIAYEEYGHPSHWRHIAEANHIQDPRNLKPGQILILPKLA